MVKKKKKKKKSAEKNAGLFPHRTRLSSTFFSANISQAKNGGLFIALLLFRSRAGNVFTLLAVPHDYICVFFTI